MEQKIDELNKKIALRKQQLEADIAELERKPNARLKQLRMEKMNVDAEYNQIPRRIELLQKEQSASMESLTKWQNAELEKLQTKIGETDKVIETIDKKGKLLTDQRDKELDNIRKSFEIQKKDLKNACDQQKAKVNAELESKEKNAVQRKGELLAQMDAELKGLGVDVNQLDDIRQQLQKVSDELKYIEDHHPDFIQLG